MKAFVEVEYDDSGPSMAGACPNAIRRATVVEAEGDALDKLMADAAARIKTNEFITIRRLKYIREIK